MYRYAFISQLVRHTAIHCNLTCLQPLYLQILMLFQYILSHLIYLGLHVLACAPAASEERLATMCGSNRTRLFS